MLTTEELMGGDLEVIGLLPWASNYSLLGMLNGQKVVYKPRRGEAPLWDFASGTLCNREVAAHVVSEAGGWEFVPPTVLRDGPLGLGAVQVFVDHDPNVTAFELLGRRDDELRSIAVFDLITNNADRKAGHVLVDPDSHIWAVDHGICFHEDPKLRTVLWDFAGDPISGPDLEFVERLQIEMTGEVCEKLETLLSTAEIGALESRIEFLISNAFFPHPGPGRNYPWPPT